MSMIVYLQTADTQAMDAANEEQLNEQEKADEMDTEQADLQLETEREKLETVLPPQLAANELSESLTKSRKDKDGDEDDKDAAEDKVKVSIGGLLKKIIFVVI